MHVSLTATLSTMAETSHQRHARRYAAIQTPSNARRKQSHSALYSAELADMSDSLNIGLVCAVASPSGSSISFPFFRPLRLEPF